MKKNINPLSSSFFTLCITLLALLSLSCAKERADSNSENVVKADVALDSNDIEGTVVKLIDQNEFSRALEWLESMEMTAEVESALQRVHLNYGLGLMNMTVSTMAQGKQPAGGMNTNMYAAMRQFLAAYHINPQDEAANVAKAQLQTIMSVYSTMPDRLDAVPAGIRDSLRTIGFNL